MAGRFVLLSLAILLLSGYALLGLIRPQVIQRMLIRYYESRPRLAKLNPFLPMIGTDDYLRFVRIMSIWAMIMAIVATIFLWIGLSRA